MFNGIVAFRFSYWVRLANISTVQADVADLPGLPKVRQHKIGKVMISSEFVSKSLLYRALPYTLFGNSASDPKIPVSPCCFVDKSEDFPDVPGSPRACE